MSGVLLPALVRCCVLALALAGLTADAASADAQSEAPVLKRRIISIHEAGKEVSRIQLPFDVPGKVVWKARTSNTAYDGSVHLIGDVELSLSLGTLPTISLSGSEMRIRSQVLGADEAQAVRDLGQMGVSDQSIRGDPSTRSAADLARQQVVDRANMQRLSAIIDQFGWPGNRFGGVDNAGVAFMVLQHADLNSQRKYLPVLRTAVAKSDASRADLAMLEDRVLVGEGRAQRYGTQFKSTRPLLLRPIEDEANLALRRIEVGLPPMADYLALMRERYKAP